jgi:multidrug efflux system outer membrane protein
MNRRPSNPALPARRRALLAAAMTALFGAGCSTPQPSSEVLAQPPAPMPDAWRGVGDASANLADRPHGALFRDAELEALITEALSSNRDLRIAAQRVELALAQYGLQRSVLWPTIAADGSVTRQRSPSALSATENQWSSLYRAGLAMPAWEIDLWGRLRNLSDAALSNAESTEALRRFVHVGLVSRVALGWLDLLEIDQSLEISRRTTESRVESLRIVRLRFEAGVVSMVDVTQAETSLAQAQAATAALQLRRGLQENALSILVGRNPGPLTPSMPLASYTLPETLPAGIPSALLTRRADIRAAELALSATDSNVEAARKAYLPSISLTGFLGFVSPQLSQLIDSDRAGVSVQPAITLPLFTGGRLQSGLDIAVAQQRIAAEDYARTTQAALREVEDALVRFQRLREQRAATERIVVASQERLRLVDLRYVNGISSFFEVLESQRQLFDAELQLTQITSGTYASVIELYRALGGGWQPG